MEGRYHALIAQFVTLTSRHTGGNSRRDILFATGIASMAMSFYAVSERWAYGIGRSHQDRLGRTDVRRGLSDRSGGIVLTMSLCLASSTFAICSTHIKNITTKLAHTCHCTRMHRSPAPSRPSVTRWPCQFWAGCTTNIYECNFPTGTGAQSSHPGVASAHVGANDVTAWR